MADGIDCSFYVDYGGLSFMIVSNLICCLRLRLGRILMLLKLFIVEAQGKNYQFDLTQTQVSDTRTETSGNPERVALDDKLTDFYVYVIPALAEGLYTDTPSGSPF